jgi:hypothetical protein
MQPYVVAVLTVALVSVARGEDRGRFEELIVAERVAGPCGPAVKQRLGAIHVSPSGGVDTENLQCALDLAIASGRRTTITLAPGVFRTAQLVARSFRGALRGARKDATVIMNTAERIYVTPDFLSQGDPSEANPWPSLIAFVDGDFRVSDLSIRVVGPEPTTGWSVFGIEPPIKGLAHGIVVIGTRANASFVRLDIEGDPTPDDFYGVTIGNGVIFEGFGRPGAAPLAGHFEVRDCRITNVASPVPFINVRDASAVISGNRFEGTLFGGEVSDFENGSYTFVGNRITRLAPLIPGVPSSGVIVYDFCENPPVSACATSGARLTIVANAIETPADGIDLFTTFGEGVSCSIIANAVQVDPSGGGAAVYLGPGTSGCIVLNNGPIVDEGTDNRVVTLP